MSTLLAHLALSDISLAILIYAIGAVSGYAVCRFRLTRSK